jgi:hypothetical protein
MGAGVTTKNNFSRKEAQKNAKENQRGSWFWMAGHFRVFLP